MHLLIECVESKISMHFLWSWSLFRPGTLYLLSSRTHYHIPFLSLLHSKTPFQILNSHSLQLSHQLAPFSIYYRSHPDFESDIHPFEHRPPDSQFRNMENEYEKNEFIPSNAIDKYVVRSNE